MNVKGKFLKCTIQLLVNPQYDTLKCLATTRPFSDKIGLKHHLVEGI